MRMNEGDIKREMTKLENLYEVTSLTKNHPNHIRKGTFARMITFVDPNQERQEKR